MERKVTAKYNVLPRDWMACFKFLIYRLGRRNFVYISRETRAIESFVLDK